MVYPVTQEQLQPARDQARRVPLPELARTFLMLGLLGFGGPAAHIALMEQELVNRRGWLSRAYFLDLLAAINLVPGPNSAEMVLYIGWLTGRFWGMLAACVGFIGPAVVLSVALAMIYTAAGSVPAISGLLNGVKPVVLVLILSAAYRLGRKAIDDAAMRVLLVLALALVAMGDVTFMGFFGLTPTHVPELTILLITGLLYVTYRWQRRRSALPVIAWGPLAGLAGSLPPLTSLTSLAARMPGLLDLFGQFFVIGSTLFGSGYVLIAYMQRAFVSGLGWMTPQQLLDTLAIGQSTPGPLTSTASAAGYILTVTPGNLWSGVPGALAATAGVFLPAFVIVAILGKVVPLLRRYPLALDLLKGVNAGVIALLAGAFFDLSWAALIRPAGVDWLSLLLAGLAFVALERFKISPLALIGLGALIGLARVPLGLAG
jgi:chromate transporter